MLIDGEGPGLPHPRDPFPQRGPDVVIQQEGLAVQGVDGKEIRPARRYRRAGNLACDDYIFDWRVIRALRLLRKLLYVFLRRATSINPSSPEPNNHATAGTGTAVPSPAAQPTLVCLV